MNRTLQLLVPALLGTSCFVIPALSFAASASIPTQGSIAEFATPSPSSSPQGVDVALDGSVWYSETAAGKIAVLRPDRSSAEFAVPNGGQPFILKAGIDGIWFTDSANHAIGHLDPGTGKITEYAIPSGAAPFFIQIARDGSKWFSETAGVGRLAPDGSITEWAVTLEHPDDNIEQLSLDPRGKLWFVERNFDGAGAAGTNKVRRLDPRSNTISTYRVPTLGGNPAGVIANPDGTVWVSEYFANAIALLDPLTAPHEDEIVAPNAKPAGKVAAPVTRTVTARAPATRTLVASTAHVVQPIVTPGWIEYPLPTANAEAEDMRTDRHGRLWFEEDAGLLAVLEPRSARITEYPIPSPDSGYYNIALDHFSGALWFTEAGVFAPVPTRIGYLDTRR